MAEPLILDPNEPSGFRPAGGGGGIEILSDPIDVGTYHDAEPIIDTRSPRPSMVQRMSGLENGRERRESRPLVIRSKRNSVISGGNRPSDKFQFYRFEKDGDDWQYARRRKLPATQSDMEKQVRKWRGTVLGETKKMGELRASQLQRLIDDANAEEYSDSTWDVAFVDSDKVTVGNTVKCRKMDVILALKSKKSTTNGPKPRSKSSSSLGQVIDILEPVKTKSKDKKKNKDFDDDSTADYTGKGKEHKRKDSVLDDPFQESVLFHRTGKPMDDRGPIEFANAGLPPEIPRDRPIGSHPHGHNDNKRSKNKSDGGDGHDSHSHHGGQEDAIVAVDEHLPHGNLGDSIEAILSGGAGGGGGGGRNNKSRSRSRSQPGAHFEPIEVEPGRSRSRRRSSQPGGGGGRSRSRPAGRSSSRPNNDPIRFPPSYYTQTYMHSRPPSDAVSSGSSGESRYGLDREERSSYTSVDTFQDLTGRGTGYDDVVGGIRYDRRDSSKHSHHGGGHGDKAYHGNGGYGYKEHHRGPSVSRSRGNSGRGTPRYPSGAGGEIYEMPASARRRSKGYYGYDQPIPEGRRIGYYDDPREVGPLVRRSTYDGNGSYERELRDRGFYGPPDRRDSYSRRDIGDRRGGMPDRREVKLHYPEDLDLVDLKVRDREREKFAEDYQRESVKDEWLEERERGMERQERELGRREARMDEIDWERERDRDRDRGYDDGYGRGGGGGYYGGGGGSGGYGGGGYHR